MWVGALLEWLRSRYGTPIWNMPSAVARDDHTYCGIWVILNYLRWLGGRYHVEKRTLYSALKGNYFKDGGRVDLYLNTCPVGLRAKIINYRLQLPFTEVRPGYQQQVQDMIYRFSVRTGPVLLGVGQGHLDIIRPGCRPACDKKSHE
jgi:hypothetical protein